MAIKSFMIQAPRLFSTKVKCNKPFPAVIRKLTVVNVKVVLAAISTIR